MADDLIEVDLLKGKYDESNQLVLPANKKKTKTEPSVQPQVKILSRSKRKLLQKQLIKKQKKLNRNDLWKELESFQTQDTPATSVGKLFSRNRKTERRERKTFHGLQTKNKWRPSESSSSESSVDTDQFSSTDDVNEEAECCDNPGQTKPPRSLSSFVESRKSVEEVVSSNANLDVRIEKKFVLLNRDPKIEEARLALPIVAEEASIMDKISKNDVVILCGATGCGKTTQLPQFLYEAGYTKGGYKIGVTEPRRVAAISMSERVATELGLLTGEVGYHIRYEKNIVPKTEIKFMTDGILLQEIKKDFQLSSYSAIIIDEAHERTIYTDVLLGLLSLVTRIRRRKFNENPDSDRMPLKLIIMSATLRVDDFANNIKLFPTIGGGLSDCMKAPYEDDVAEDECPGIRPGAPPVVNIESRQFPVTCHFARYTPEDYMKATLKKVLTIHKDAPLSGGILVFLTGQREVKTLCKWLTKAVPATGGRNPPGGVGTTKAIRKRHSRTQQRVCSPSEDSPSEAKKTRKIRLSDDLVESVEKPTTEAPQSRLNLDNFDIIPADEEAELGLRCEQDDNTRNLHQDKSAPTSDTPDASGQDKNDEEEEEEEDQLEALDEEVLREVMQPNAEKPVAPICALPLYSLLPPEHQKRVFNQPPEGHRLVIVSTNVAETSLTIPNIRYVVDTGKVKSKIYDTATGASCFRVVWVSQASAEQRAGRAGRVGPGHCYRLYSSRIFLDQMAPFAPPDILTRPVDEVVLLLKSYLGSAPLSRFPLPTPPSNLAVEAAERRLLALGALEEKKTESGFLRTITREGRWMARLPLPARFARMLLFANQQGLMPYAVALVAALSVPDFFLLDTSTPQAEDTNEKNEEGGSAAPKKKKQDKKGGDDSERLAQQRTKFLQQFVNTESDLMLGDLAVLLGTVCCLERYWAQLIGTLSMPGDDLSEGIDPSSVRSPLVDRVARINPVATMRQLAQQCGVRWKAFLEVRQLRRQISDILNANVPDLDLTVDPALPKPSPTQVEQLRQLFLVGSTCHLAAKFDLPTEGLPTKDRRRLRFAYKVPGETGPVFIEPASPLARENCSFIAYTELHKSSKPFLRNICAINPAWIPFLAPRSYRVEGLSVMEPTSGNASKSATDDKEEVNNRVDEAESSDTVAYSQAAAALPYTGPFYDPEHDCVMAFAKRVYFTGADLVVAASVTSSGAESFELPAAHTPVPLGGTISNRAAAASLGDHEALVWSVRWFARSLLEGKVYPTDQSLGAWFPKLLKSTTPTRIITISWGLVRPEVRNLISKMLPKKIASKRQLEACLLEDPQFLAKELTAWLPTEHHAAFLLKWPPIKKEDD